MLVKYGPVRMYVSKGNIRARTSVYMVGLYQCNHDGEEKRANEQANKQCMQLRERKWNTYNFLFECKQQQPQQQQQQIKFNKNKK